LGNLTGDYLAFCFLAALGVIQIAAAYARLSGILFLRKRIPSSAFGLLLFAAGLLWFFLPGPRLVPDTLGGLNGNQQSLYFAMCAFAALAVTLAVTSVTNHAWLRGNIPASGLDALRTNTYAQAMMDTVRRWKKSSLKQTLRSLSGLTTLQ
jgi:hypothetical protein